MAAGVVLLDRGLGLIALVLVAAAACAPARWRDAGRRLVAYLWMAFGLTVVAARRPCVAPLLARALSPLRWLGHGWVDARIDVLMVMVGRFGTNRRAVVAAFVGALLVQLVLVALLRGGRPSAWGAAESRRGPRRRPSQPPFQMLPLSINGFGVREAVFVYYFARLGLPADAALAVSLVATATLAVFSTTGGLAFLLRQRAGLAPPAG